MNKPIFLITDFGDGHYVGQMKSVILSINKEAKIIDFTHQIEPQNIHQTGFILGRSFEFFPEDSIIQIVVDPGVGSNRDIIVAKINNRWVLSPDNGILTELKHIIDEVYSVDLAKLNFNYSNTFHGRDIFSRISAQLSLNHFSYDYFLRKELEDLVEIDLKPKKEVNKMNGEVLYFDHYGNAVTNIPAGNYHRIEHSFFVFNEVSKTFSSVDIGDPVCYVGSFNTLELAIRNGSFKSILKDLTDTEVSALI